MYCYTDYPTAELFVNGKSQGKISKNDTTRLDRYRLRWRNVLYEPGELKVVVYDAQGNKAGEQTLRTAGEPATLKLEVDRNRLAADGRDLAFITVSLVDNEGNFCPTRDDLVTVSVADEGTFKAICNGDATSLEQFTVPRMHLFNGKLVVVVQSTKKAGDINVTIAGGGFKQTVTLTSK